MIWIIRLISGPLYQYILDGEHRLEIASEGIILYILRVFFHPLP